MGDALGSLFCGGVILIAFGMVAAICVKQYRVRPARPANLAQLAQSIDLFAQLSEEDQERELATMRERVRASHEQHQQ